MTERPPQPPEGKLIAAALDARGLSIREAAKRAGISYGRWRQITSGYQNVSPGSYAAVRAPAKTLARMAAVAGVTAEQMEAAGRPDAAGAMRALAPLSPAPELPRIPAEDDDDEVIRLLIARYPPMVRDTLEKIWGLDLPRAERLKLLRSWLRDNPGESPRARAAG